MPRRAYLVAALLPLGAGCGRAPDAPVPTAGRGALLYAQICVPCHHDDGRGLARAYPSLAGSPVVNGDPFALVRWVLNGERPAAMPAGRYAARMPPFAWLKDNDAALLLSHVRGSFGNQSLPVDEATVTRARSGKSQ